MAQLDSITWLPQIIWFSIIFFTVYTFVYKEFAPLAFYSQNLRSKKIEKQDQFVKKRTRKNDEG